MATYTPDDVSLLTNIRSDILARPASYCDGETFLRTEYGPERLQQDAMAHWKRYKDHPNEMAQNHFVAQHQSQDIADPVQRETRFQEVLEQLSAPPKADQWGLDTCACRAISQLMKSHGEHHDAKAQAVLLLAVMLWDADAYKRHSIFTLFGVWGATPADKIESSARWVAASFLNDQSSMRSWMNTVRMAWTALPKPIDAVPTDAPTVNPPVSETPHPPSPAVKSDDALTGQVQAVAFKHHEKTYNTADLKAMTQYGNSALGRYTSLAKVTKPAAGKKNHRYTAQETRDILRAIIDNVTEVEKKKRCQNVLDNLL